jgi:hypothetical protein
MFPIWAGKCLRKLGRSSYKIVPALLFQEAFEAKLPPDFIAVRECWITANSIGPQFRLPGSFYQQITTVLNRPYDPCNAAISCDPCNPDIVTVITKTNTEVSHSIRLKALLVPGNISVKHDCAEGCLNFHASGELAFDIRDGKIVTNFREGDIYMVYYSSQTDECGNELIPENYRIQEFIEAFLKEKIFEQLYNQITDETFNQIERKYLLYKQKADEAFIMADIEIKKKTIYRKAYDIRRDEHRLDKYRIGMESNPRWRNRGLPASSWGLNE